MDKFKTNLAEVLYLGCPVVDNMNMTATPNPKGTATMLSIIKIEQIRPMPADFDANDDFVHRTTIRTFKVSHRDHLELEALANQLLAAFLDRHPGTIGTWTTSSWVRPYESYTPAADA